MQILSSPITKAKMIKKLDANYPLTQAEVQTRYAFKKYARIVSGTFGAGTYTFSCPFIPKMCIGNAYRPTGNYYGLFFAMDSSLDKIDTRFYDGTIYGVGTSQSNFSVGVSISNLGGGSYRISGLNANFVNTDSTQMIMHVYGE